MQGSVFPPSLQPRWVSGRLSHQRVCRVSRSCWTSATLVREESASAHRECADVPASVLPAEEDIAPRTRRPCCADSPNSRTGSPHDPVPLRQRGEGTRFSDGSRDSRCVLRRTHSDMIRLCRRIVSSRWFQNGSRGHRRKRRPDRCRNLSRVVGPLRGAFNVLNAACRRFFVVEIACACSRSPRVHRFFLDG